MFVSCLAFTKDIPIWQIHIAMSSFDAQIMRDSQLIIINNKSTISDCAQLEFPFNSRIVVIDRPGFSNGRALLEGLRLGTGQAIAHFPLDHYHHPQRLQWSLDTMLQSNCPLVAPTRKLSLIANKLQTITPSSNVIAELAVYRSPAYTDNYEIDYGAWWQYPLLAYGQGMDIAAMDQLVAVELPCQNIPCDYRSIIEV